MASKRVQWVRIVLLALIVGCFASTLCVSTGRDVSGILLMKAQVDVRCIADAVRDFRAKARRMPASLDELAIRHASGVRFLEYLPSDSWAHEYELREHGEPRGMFVVSAGPNGVFGDGDDVSARVRVRP